MKNNLSHFRRPPGEAREGRGGGADQPPIFNAPAIVIWSIGFLVLAFIIMAVLPRGIAYDLERAAGVTPLRFLAGPNASGGVPGMLAPLFAHMALHADMMHIFFNCVWLLIFGTPVARRLGAGRHGAGILPASLFISFLALSGAAGALTYIAFNLKSIIIMIGASGGISGLLGAMLRIMLRRRVHFARNGDGLAPLTDRNLIIWSIVIIILNIFMAYSGNLLAPQDASIAWEAHIGGFLFGLVAFPLFDALARRA